ncbi:MAG: chaperone, ATP12 [Acetobacteraceae bacterium]|nr:chaperone, ATP12 [Acetobacteraceae bacterium]
MKRFWETASAVPTEQGYAVLLDKKPMRLPGGAVLQVHSAALAQALADEWQAAGGQRGGEMSFADTPLTRLAGTAQARIAPDPGPTADAIARYAVTDLLCYRADWPPELVHRQAKLWQPWLDWAALTYDAPLRVTTGVIHVHQQPQALSALRYAVHAMPPAILAGLGIAVPALGSLVLGLALAEGALDASAAHALATLDEAFQAEQWGEDAGAAARRRSIAEEVALAARFMKLAKS